jgi:hypothetical protein
MGSYDHPGMDMEEALFRATRDDPWSPLTPEEQQMLQAAKMDPWTGYTSNKSKETLQSETKSDDMVKETLKYQTKSDDKAKDTHKSLHTASDDDMAMMRFL